MYFMHINVSGRSVLLFNKLMMISRGMGVRTSKDFIRFPITGNLPLQHCNLDRLLDIITCFPKCRGHMTLKLNTSLSVLIYRGARKYRT